MRKEDFKKAMLPLPSGPVAFYHNMPMGNVGGVEGAFEIWLFRTRELTVASFQAYIKEKNAIHKTGHAVLTEEEYARLE